VAVELTLQLHTILVVYIRRASRRNLQWAFIGAVSCHLEARVASPSVLLDYTSCQIFLTVSHGHASKPCLMFMALVNASCPCLLSMPLVHASVSECLTISAVIDGSAVCSGKGGQSQSRSPNTNSTQRYPTLSSTSLRCIECQSDSTCRQKASNTLKNGRSTPNHEEKLLEASPGNVCATLGVPFVVDASGRRQRGGYH
jgi:hypothetical protein